jgi:hypothetical protein
VRAGVPRRVRSAQESAIETHEQLPRRKLHEEECQENLCSKLLVTDRAFHTAFLGFRGTAPREMRAKVAVIDTLRGHDREDEVDDPLKGADSEEGDEGFVLSSEFARLSEGGSWLCHNSRTPPFFVPVEKHSATCAQIRLGQQKTEDALC